MLFLAVNRLHKLVAENLADVDLGWWLSRVPPELRGAAEGRHDSEGEVMAVEDVRMHPVMYLSLGELFDLIYVRENWDGVFRAVFHVKRAGVEESARRLIALRNRVADSRSLSPQALQDLEVAIRRLGLGDGP